MNSLAGTPAFRGESKAALIHDLLKGTPAPIDPLRPGLPAGLTSLVEQLLEKEPERRPSSADEVANRLREIALEQDLGATMPLPAVGTSDARSDRVQWSAAIVVLIGHRGGSRGPAIRRSGVFDGGR